MTPEDLKHHYEAAVRQRGEHVETGIPSELAAFSYYDGKAAAYAYVYFRLTGQPIDDCKWVAKQMAMEDQT